ncbi:MAG TPA: hypothetical protein VG692_02655 [Gemmatimonadales bacterium]|nr:hypothetical protein [Gemmatimonadales bacterium]
MQSFFVVCAILGGAVLALQLVLGLLGIADLHHVELASHHDHPAAQGLDLLSVRALAAGVAFFGVGGLFGLWLGLGGLLAVPVALVPGGLAMVGVARALRALRGLEADYTVLIEEAIGERGTVYLSIPAAQGGKGKVHLELRGRFAELPAVTLEGELPTGASVLVTDVIDDDTLVVVRDPLQPEVHDVVR